MAEHMTRDTKQIFVGEVEADRYGILRCMHLMEQQKERVDALLLVISDGLEPGTYASTLAKLAKSIQEDHKYWYQIQDALNIRDDLIEEADDE